ncbi:MAG: glycyl-radical enzyme activating protein [Bacteroidetes bacterium]|nr:MAG: glycyl-radical enzyme activating protein [Bacteroidota bacterium]
MENLVFDIKRYAINDGPGIRVTVFLKGCPLSCEWCHNPEGMSKRREKLYTSSKCIGCEQCVEVCEQDACMLTPEGIVTNREDCTLCGKCAEVCPTKATEISGEAMSVEDLMKIIRRETLIMDQSEGGVTFSGGEPLMHYRFLLELLEACGREGIHRCVDTTGFANTEVLLKVADKTDHFLYDLKMMDSEKHKKYTGVPNEKILENLKILSTNGTSYDIRIPLIGGVNDDDENIRQTAAFIAELQTKPKRIQILPYHNIASKKYEKLGGVYDQGLMTEPGEETQESVIKTFGRFGLTAEIGA